MAVTVTHFSSSGVWRNIIQDKFTDFLKERLASILREQELLSNQQTVCFLLFASFTVLTLSAIDFSVFEV
jgi:hypothetical protein